jgi:ssDNA-binding Zn-finger/Zn-ribbon topoisomerase 1
VFVILPDFDGSVICADCGAQMVLRKSPKYKSPFWGCSNYPECRGAHGAHPDGRPLGKPANKETKQARIRAHDVFDTLWKCGGIGMNRRQAYKLLAEKLGVSEVHIGEADLTACERIIEAAKELLRERGVQI